jgi:hypothetical protein
MLLSDDEFVCPSCNNDLGTNPYCVSCREHIRQEERATYDEQKRERKSNARRRQREETA